MWGRKGDNFKRYAKTNARICFRVPFEVDALTTPHLESLDCQVVVMGPQNPLHVVLAVSLLSNSGPSGVSFTDASHFTEEMSCQLLPPALFTTLIRDLKIKVCDRIAGMHMPPIEHALMAA